MPEVYSVVAQISPDQVSEGFYTLDDGLLTMVHDDGSPVKLLDDSAVQHRLLPDDNEVAIAKMLTRKIRKHFRGETGEGFTEKINYARAGVA